MFRRSNGDRIEGVERSSQKKSDGSISKAVDMRTADSAETQAKQTNQDFDLLNGWRMAGG